jgi:hypothetical protein
MPGILLNSFTAVASRHRRCGTGASATSSQFYSTTSMDSSNNSRHTRRNYHHDSSSSASSSRRTTPGSTTSNSAMNTPDRSSSPTPQDRWYSHTATATVVATAPPQSHSQRPATASVSSGFRSRHASLWGTEIPNTEPNMSWGQFIDFDTSSSY